MQLPETLVHFSSIAFIRPSYQWMKKIVTSTHDNQRNGDDHKTYHPTEKPEITHQRGGTWILGVVQKDGFFSDIPARWVTCRCMVVNDLAILFCLYCKNRRVGTINFFQRGNGTNGPFTYTDEINRLFQFV